MVSKTRAQRIAERIREELSEILVQEVVDPRLAGIFVTAVEVDRELEYANVYISALEGADRWKEILEGLKHAHGFLRSQLASRIELRAFPRLRFHWDPTFERAEKLESLFQQLEDEHQSPGDAGADDLGDEGTLEA